MSSPELREEARIDVGQNLSIEERRAHFIEQITIWAAKRRAEDALTRQELANFDSAQRLVAQKHALLDNFAHIYRQNPRADVAPGCLLFVTLFSDNNRGHCEYSMDRIARFFGRSQRAIQDAMKRLDAQGAIFRELRGRGYVYWPVVNRAFAVERAHHGWLVEAMAPRKCRKSTSGVAQEHRKSGPKIPEVEQHHSLLRELTKEKLQNGASRKVVTAQELQVPGKTKPAFLRKSALPEKLKLSGEGLDFAIKQGMTEAEVRESFEEFCDHHIAKGNQMADWQRAWKQWVRNGFSYGHTEKKRASKANKCATLQRAAIGRRRPNRAAMTVDAVMSELVDKHDLQEEAIQWLRPLFSMPGKIDDPMAWSLMMVKATEEIEFSKLEWAAEEAVKNCHWRPAPAVLRAAAKWKQAKNGGEGYASYGWFCWKEGKRKVLGR